MAMRFIRFFVVLSAAVAAAGAVGSNTLTATDAQEVQAVITAQFTAFAHDDADGAFAVATPEMRKAAGSSTRFLAMVRGAYPMVYHPASITFQKPREDERGVLQMVQITDDDSKSWLALFELQRQPDASWRISRCVVVENKWLDA